MTLACLLVLVQLAATDGNSWVLSTEDTRARIAIADGRPVVASLECVADGHGWATEPMPVPLMRTIGLQGSEYSVPWAFVDGVLSTDGTTLTLTFQNDQPKLRLKSIWRARPGRGPIEHRLELENGSDTPIGVTRQDSLALSGLTPQAGATIHWIKRGAGNASTQGGTFVEPLTAQTSLNLVSNCDDGASPVPWLAVQDDHHGLYVGWEFSGLGRIEAKAGDNGAKLDIAVGLLPDFVTDIAPGETFHVPAAFVGCYAGDVEEGSYSLHRWILTHLRPTLPDDIPDPILAFNLYLDAGGPSATEADVLRSAQFCKDLGFEAFMPDAMWFPACGDWRWDPARFPSGISPIEKFVHDSGMKMALWCAWTNGGISEDPGALSVRGPVGHPDWFDSDFPPDWKPGPFYGGRVCLACPEAEAWETQKTQWLVSNHNLDYLKHDCGPIVTKCNKTTHRHKYGIDTSYWAATAYYRIQEALRAANPRLILENCSGGGHIKDFGVIQRTHYTVTTDTLSNLPDRQSIYDSTFAFPPMLLQAYTYEWEYKVPGDDPGSFLWRSAMMGAWQIDPTRSKDWSAEAKASARHDAQIYKDWVRPMLKDAKVYHVLPRPDGVHWDGMFYWSPSLRRGTFYVFRPDAPEDRQTVPLKGLDPNKRFWVWSEDGSVEPGIRTGKDLLQTGLTPILSSRYTCDLVYVQDADLATPAGMDRPGPFTLDPPQPRSDAFHASATLTWTASPNARKYRVTVATDPEFKDILATQLVHGLTADFSNLSPGAQIHWKVDAVGWGGQRASDAPAGDFTLPALQPLEGITFLSDMPWQRATAGADNRVHRDTNYSGKEISIAGKPYPKGLWTHAFNDATPAEIEISLEGLSVIAFAADAGLEDSSGAGSVQFRVLVDGAPKAESPILHQGQTHRFQVDITGAKTLTLQVLNGNDGYVCDHAACGFARLIAPNAKDPL